MQLVRRLSGLQWLAFVLITAPAIYLTWFVYTYTVNVPFWDQWEIVPIIQNINDGNLNWNDFWKQHNEHRLLLPRIIMITSAYLTNWNLKTETLISIMLAVMSFGLLIKTVQLTYKKPFTWQVYGLLVLCSLIWFSPVQFENWLWGWQIQWYLNVLAVMGVIYSIALLLRNKDSNGALIAGVGSAAVAQYSLGNGVLLWPILLLSLWFIGIEKKKLAIAAAAGVVSTLAYYIGYHNPDGPSKTLALKEPLDFIKYYFAYLGRPLTYRPKLSFLLGVAMTITYAVAALYLLIKRRKQFNASLPWFALGLYVFMSAGITSLSRLGFGVVTSMTSRYSTISSLLVVSLILLLYMNREIVKKVFRIKQYFGYLIAAAYVTVAVLVAFNFSWGIDKAQKQSAYLTDIRTCTHRNEPEEICYLSAYPSVKIVKPRLEYLKSIKWGGY